MIKQKKIGVVGKKPNKEGTWGVKDEEGRILKKFRTRQTAEGAKSKIRLNKYEKLSVVRLIPKKTDL